MIINKSLLLGEQEASRAVRGARPHNPSRKTIQINPGGSQSVLRSFTARRDSSSQDQMSIADHVREIKNFVSDRRAERQARMEQMESAREQARIQAEIFRNMRIAMEIAARIMRGDNVPQSDKDFLLYHNPGMFKLAMTARNHHNEDPKDYEALAERERRSSSSEQLLVQNATISPGAAASAATSSVSSTASAAPVATS